MRERVRSMVEAANTMLAMAWSTRALSVEIEEGTSVRIVALDDIIDSKRAANRPKDQMALPYLESLRDELRNR